MGKDSKHQRTKGGVQPSSASRTANLLEKVGEAGQPLTFLSAAAEARADFAAFSNTVLPTIGSGSPVHSILANVLIDDGLPPDIRLIFRKLQKKDATTKIKALAEIVDLFKASQAKKEGDTPSSHGDASSEDVSASIAASSSQLEPEELGKQMLPQWSKNFPKLTADDSRKVREQAQITHAVICKAVGRNLAPFLKQLMPHWYLAQFDIYAPVASAAKKSYQTVFTNETKQAEVVKYCIAEIIAHISNNLDTVFKVRKPTENQKKGKGNKKAATAAPEQETAKEIGDSENMGSGGSQSMDSECFEIRTCYATLQGVNSLISLQLVNDEFLEFLFGNDGVFWDGAEFTKDSLIRRSCFDLLSNFLGTRAKVDNAPEIIIPASRCSKLMNSALSASQKEILPSIWNTFLTLTMQGVFKDGQLAQKQLLTSAKNGFYGNATQIGPSVLPLLARILDGLDADTQKKTEFAQELTKSFIKGYQAERSNFEKAAILRTFAEAIGFLMKNEVCDIETTENFIIENLKSINSEFPKFLGALVKDATFYELLTEKAKAAGVLNTKEFGDFVVGLATPPATLLYTDNKQILSRKAVKFRENEGSSDAETPRQSFEALPENKQKFLQDFVTSCVSSHSYVALSVVSRFFSHSKLWSAVNISDIDLAKEDDKCVRLRLSLDLIQQNPDNPQILGIFSDQFDCFKEAADLQVFLKELNSFTHLPPIKRWIRMSVFTDVIETSLNTWDLQESELAAILKFVLKENSQESFIAKVCTTVVGRMDWDNAFFDNLARIMTYSNFKVDVSPIYGRFWEVFLQKSVDFGRDENEDRRLELAESVCARNHQKLSSQFLMEKLENQIDACSTVKQIECLVEICRKLDFADEDIELALKLSTMMTIKDDVLSFVGVGYAEIVHDTLEPVPKFAGPHKSTILKSIFQGYYVQNGDSEELIQPLINILVAQSITRIWKEVEKAEYFEHLSDDLSQALEVMSSRLIENIYSKPSSWKKLKNELERIVAYQQDPLWTSRLPIRILLEYCEKAEINLEIQCTFTTPEDSQDLKTQMDKILGEFSLNNFQIKKNTAWITDMRNKKPDDFEFETLYRHTKDKTLLNKLLLITLELLERVDAEDEDFLSSGTCWVEAWLKHTKYLEPSSKTHMLWVSNLARAVQIIDKRATSTSPNNVCPKFLQEYVEFHCAQIYPIIYALYLQLNNEIPSHTFWSLQALVNVSGALATMPGTTLAFIEPDSIKSCDIFSKILGSGIHLPTRIAAYKALKKVRYDTGEAKDLPIIPPGIDEVIRELMDRCKISWSQEFETDAPLRESYEEERTFLVSYLLIWDALLKIQQSSNEFASYVRDQDHLLTPFLNTLFFSESISLENAASKCFDTDPVIVPGTRINLLHLSCSVLQRALRNLPYTVRWWWNTHVTKQRDRVFVEKYVVKHLSSKLAAEELGSVKLREGIDDNVTVHCHSGCNELVAHYRIEETNVTLTISLPLNHPLGPVTVRISDKKLHAKISHLLNTRSHSLSAGLKLWKENLDGLYKDVDECAICFFILHHVTKQTPKLACKTCRKKFHAACLYKWFSTSNKSECPLCRNLF